MSKMKINILLPFPPNKPAGGVRVMYEYANYLNELGHEITIYHTLKCSYMDYKYPFWLRWVYFNIKVPPQWFKLNKGITSKTINSVNNNNIDDGDVLLYTWWALGFDVQRLTSQKGKLFSLIQDLEYWSGNEDKVNESFFLDNIQKIIISEHIRKYVYNMGGVNIKKISFAIDDKLFFIKQSIASRNDQTICMMYSVEPRKGSEYGLSALLKLKKKYPALQVNLFGICDAPADLPKGFTYYKSPGNLPDIMNSSAIFLGPSIQEGCALPPMEAMHCGCAVVCTAIEGHSEYAFDKETAALFESKNIDDCVNAISDLFNNVDKRIRIAQKGNDFIKQNTWRSSTKELEGIFTDGIKKR
ncbi:glycosyltransferase family 4 protein [Mucilaginibacter sp. HMF5004]|uniref:glycosyltransferase family 4 protein n=1 Tax=Mucilaginibacter rivuli TaxID=2857527 RepID=UPI001C5CF3EE|nr:glycosyltransferase family 4 protein [Mucilaginibacter rivuli]MBW4889886.1 glycosyltransferase family 4 protein [Mucilaginibacter rivuli]